jgi:hypothetical protein
MRRIWTHEYGSRFQTLAPQETRTSAQWGGSYFISSNFYQSNLHNPSITLADIKIGAGDALEPQTPDRLHSTMVA